MMKYLERDFSLVMADQDWEEAFWHVAVSGYCYRVRLFVHETPRGERLFYAPLQYTDSFYRRLILSTDEPWPGVNFHGTTVRLHGTPFFAKDAQGRDEAVRRTLETIQELLTESQALPFRPLLVTDVRSVGFKEVKDRLAFSPDGNWVYPLGGDEVSTHGLFFPCLCQAPDLGSCRVYAGNAVEPFAPEPPTRKLLKSIIRKLSRRLCSPSSLTWVF